MKILHSNLNWYNVLVKYNDSALTFHVYIIFMLIQQPDMPKDFVL
jgi:hypothetical protein